MALMAEAKDDNIHAEEHNPGSAQELNIKQNEEPTISATHVCRQICLGKGSHRVRKVQFF